MHSTYPLGKSAPEQSTESLPLDLQLVKPLGRQRPLGGFWRMMIVCEVVADLLTITLSIALSYTGYYSFSLGKHLHYPTHTVLSAALGFAIIMVLMLDRAGAYARGNSLLRVRETEQVLRVSSQAFLIALAISFTSGFLFSRWILLLCFVLVPLALFVQKTFMYTLVNTLHTRGYGNERVLIYGAGNTGRRVFSTLKRSPRLGLDPVLFVDDDPPKCGTRIFEMNYEPRRSAPVAEGPITNELLREHEIDSVIVAVPSLGREGLIHTIEEAFKANARVSVVPSQFLSSESLVDYQDIDGVLLISFGKSASKRSYEVIKRCIDVLGALILLIVGLPLLLALAVLVRLDSAGSAWFTQDRIGRNGRRFRMYKFRTMYLHASGSEYSPKDQDDPRITRLGRFLRKTSLDEVPQLLNVLKGEMSLVGPRPEMPFIVEQYAERHRQRLQVKPGLTGLWQLSGDRAFLIHENIEYDLYYIKHRNVFMDLAVLLHTSIFAMRGI